MKVSDSVKNEYRGSSIHKNVSIYFPELNLSVGNSSIYAESMKLKESILEKDNIEFVGCISSVFSITVSALSEDIKGKRIEVSIYTDKTKDEPIPLFHGVVDSAIMQSNKRSKKITAYDDLYTKGNIDLSSWYNGLEFPISLKNFRNSLFEYIGLKQSEKNLPNDTVMIDKKYAPKILKAQNVIKAICQINGAFGIINRSGEFEYRILKDITNTYVYPSVTLFPSQYLFPAAPDSGSSADEMKAEVFSFYKKVEFEEYKVKPVDKLTIRQSENDIGVGFGSGSNNYIIQGNMFTLDKGEDELREMAKQIYQNVSGIYYYPFKSENDGLPYVECGLDAVSYSMNDYNMLNGENGNAKNFYVFNRELKGIQALSDTYSAKGKEYQTEFITDLQTQIDTIKANIKEEVDSAIRDYDFTDQFSDYTYDKAYIDENILKVESVAELPAIPDPNTIYLIQGEVTVI